MIVADTKGGTLTFGDYLNGPKLREENERLQAQLRELDAENAKLTEQYDRLRKLAMKVGVMDAAQIQSLIESERKVLAQVQAECDRKRQDHVALVEQHASLRDQILVVEETLLLESFALYLPKFDFASSEEYKARLDSVRAEQKRLIKERCAANFNEDWSVNNSKSEGKKMVADTVKLLIRSFNNEADYCIDNVKFNNVELGEKRILQAFDSINKLGRVLGVSITEQYKSLKLDELHLAYEYKVKKQQEKEDARRAREELREQQKLEQEIRAAREKIAKERKHFQAALRDLNVRLTISSSDSEREVISAKIAEVTSSCSALDSEEQLIDYREKNAKAGYVYVISNIGAFGPDVFKIGMTRRLEPVERVDELGDASVPFAFDVHAMVFSDNAPALEAKLHEHFHGTRVNKVNHRKEFFRATIEEIETVIRTNFDAAVDVTRDAIAEQFREGLRLVQVAHTPATSQVDRMEVGQSQSVR